MKTSKKNVAKNNTRKRLNYIGGGNNSIYKSRKNRRHISSNSNSSNSNIHKKLLNKTVKVFKYRSKYKTKYAVGRYNGRGGGSFLGMIAKYFDTDTNFLSMNRKRFENFVEQFEKFKGKITRKMEGLEVEGSRIKKAADEEAIVLTDRLTNKKYNTVLNIALNDTSRFAELEGNYFDEKTQQKSALRQKFDMEMKITNAKDVDLNNRVDSIKKKVKDAQPELKDFKKQLNDIEKSLDDITKEYSKLSKYRTRVEQIRNDYNEFAKTDKKHLTRKQMKIVKKYINNKAEYDKILAFTDVTLNTIAELTNKRADLQHTLEYYTKQSENLEYAKKNDPVSNWGNTAQTFYNTLKELIADTNNVIGKIDGIYTYADKIWRQMEGSVRQEIRDKRVKFNELRGELRKFKEIFEMARTTFKQIDQEFLNITPASRIAIDVAEITRACTLSYSGLYKWYEEINGISKSLDTVQSKSQSGGAYYSDGWDIGIPVNDYKYLTQIYKHFGGGKNDATTNILYYYVSNGRPSINTVPQVVTISQPANPALQQQPQQQHISAMLDTRQKQIVNDFITASPIYNIIIDNKDTSAIATNLKNIVSNCVQYDNTINELKSLVDKIPDDKDKAIKPIITSINDNIFQLRDILLKECVKFDIGRVTRIRDTISAYQNTIRDKITNELSECFNKVNAIIDTLIHITSNMANLQSAVDEVQKNSSLSDEQKRAFAELKQITQKQEGFARSSNSSSFDDEPEESKGKQTAIDTEVINNTKQCANALENIISISNPDKSILKNFISKIVSLDKTILSMREIERGIHSFTIKKDNTYSPNISWLTGDLKKELKDEQLHLDSTKKMIEIARGIEKYNDPNTPYLKYLKGGTESGSNDIREFYNSFAEVTSTSGTYDRVNNFLKNNTKFNDVFKKVCSSTYDIRQLFEAFVKRRETYKEHSSNSLAVLFEVIADDKRKNRLGSTVSAEDLAIINEIYNITDNEMPKYGGFAADKVKAIKDEKKDPNKKDPNKKDPKSKETNPELNKLDNAMGAAKKELNKVKGNSSSTKKQKEDAQKKYDEAKEKYEKKKSELEKKE